MFEISAAVVVLAFLKMMSISCYRENNFKYFQFPRSQNSKGCMRQRWSNLDRGSTYCNFKAKYLQNGEKNWTIK